jgi:hypothetical protein
MYKARYKPALQRPCPPSTHSGEPVGHFQHRVHALDRKGRPVLHLHTGRCCPYCSSCTLYSTWGCSHLFPHPAHEAPQPQDQVYDVLHSITLHCRGELLSIRCQESQLSHSRLHISLLSQSTNRALAKGSIKLSGLLPGQHYSLALTLTDSCTLYLTVALGLGCQTLLAALQGSELTAAAAETGGKLQLLQLGLPQLDRRLQSLLSPAAAQQAGMYEVLAVWRCASAGQQQQQQQQGPVHMQLDAREGADASSGAMLRVYNSNNSLLAVGGPSRAGSAASSRDATTAAVEGSGGSTLKGLSGLLAVVPVCSSEQDVPWPVGHQVC